MQPPLPQASSQQLIADSLSATNCNCNSPPVPLLVGFNRRFDAWHSTAAAFEDRIAGLMKCSPALDASILSVFYMTHYINEYRGDMVHEPRVSQFNDIAARALQRQNGNQTHVFDTQMATRARAAASESEDGLHYKPEVDSWLTYMLLSGVCGEIKRRDDHKEHPGTAAALATRCQPCDAGGCSAGNPQDGGVALDNHNRCDKWCTQAGFCGHGKGYKAPTSTDCNPAGTLPAPTPAHQRSGGARPHPHAHAFMPTEHQPNHKSNGQAPPGKPHSPANHRGAAYFKARAVSEAAKAKAAAGTGE